MPAAPIVDAVIIGRNEGARLTHCLQSVAPQVRRLIYVDSGSTDGSLDAATAAGAVCVPLDLTRPFTAARARNAGAARLSDADFVLFIDGDCLLQPGFVAAALGAFEDHPAAVVICGRRREAHPGASVYNRLCDAEWDTPVGPTRACGGDALIRLAAFRAVGGYRDSLIAGEEPELCLRLRAGGGQVWRIAAEMTLHDANLLWFGQWWRRSVRAGHAFAEGAFLHGAGPDAHWVAETRRALIWGAGLPILTIAAGLAHPAGWLLALAYPAQVLRLTLRDHDAMGAVLSVIGKFAESLGILQFHAGRVTGRRRGLIEYR
jgi:glycosyltransferase involved in cell wall biosynthesis